MDFGGELAPAVADDQVGLSREAMTESSSRATRGLPRPLALADAEFPRELELGLLAPLARRRR